MLVVSELFHCPKGMVGKRTHLDGGVSVGSGVGPNGLTAVVPCNIGGRAGPSHLTGEHHLGTFVDVFFDSGQIQSQWSHCNKIITLFQFLCSKSFIFT